MGRGRYRHHMGARLDEKMARHRQAGRFRLAHSAQPAGNAADLHQVGHGEIAGAGGNGMRHVVTEPPILAGLHRNAAFAPHLRMADEILRRHRLLDPMQIELGQPLQPTNGFRRGLGLVVVDHQSNLGTENVAHAGDHRHIAREIAVADLDLDRLEATGQRFLQPAPVALRIDHAVGVIGRDRRANTAEHLGHRHVSATRLRIPQRHVQTRDRHAKQALPAEQAEASFQFRESSDGRGRLAAQHRRQVVQQRQQRLDRHGRVAKQIGAAGGPFLGFDVDQDQWSRRYLA